MKVKRNIISIDEEKCDGCGNCVPVCAEGAISIVDGKARLVADRYCDGLGACLGECPRGAISIVERVVDEFDDAAVEEHLHSQKAAGKQEEPIMSCGCPSTLIQSFTPMVSCQVANEPVFEAGNSSSLSNWPVQIRLVPPTAPFLRGADLLVAADCIPVAYPGFHRDFLAGRVVLVGCPKFDDVRSYTEKFTRIFKEEEIKSITVVVMEVPCCQGLPVLVRRAMELADKRIPLDVVVISTRGEILHACHDPESEETGKSPFRYVEASD